MNTLGGVAEGRTGWASRRRVIMQSQQRSALSSSMAAKLASVTASDATLGSQRTSWKQHLPAPIG